ncbi:MAG: hypothetical protein EXR66_00350 [Dehalococcoidia bacterium]|nr:hypothetical protein [Dehalococcoidia bacterium]
MRRPTYLVRLMILGAMLTVGIVAGACQRGVDSGALADRLLRLGEDSKTKLAVTSGALPADLKTALNPDATKDTAAADLVAIPVHPHGKLLGSFRVERPDGTISFFLLYDVPGTPEKVQPVIAKQVNESPWQTIGGQSNESVSALRFQSTVSSAVSGTVAIQQIAGEGGAKPTSSVIYILEIESSKPPANEPYVLPPARSIPDGFPADFVLNGMTPIEVQWAATTQGRTFQMVLRTKQSSLEVTDRYRTLFQRAGWTIAADDARGFATSLEFEKDGGTSHAAVSIDAFDQDAAYTAVQFQLQLAR